MGKKQKQKHPTLFFDGGSRGNPGLAAGGYCLRIPGQEQIFGSQILQHATNNEAEYTGLIIGLQKAIELGIERLVVKGDSQLVINQVNGHWAVKAGHLEAYHADATSLMMQFDQVYLTWIKRDKNAWADWACNCAMNEVEGLPMPERPNASGKGNKLPLLTRMVLQPGNFSFGDWAGLKVKNRRDEFTSKRLPGLLELAPDFPVELLEERWGDAEPKDIAKVYRWYLRAGKVATEATPAQLGEFAIHKCKVDQEISMNAAQARRAY